MDHLVRRTLAYRAVFKYPLSFYQLGTFLVGDSAVDCVSLRKALEEGVEAGVVGFDDGRFFLAGTQISNWVERSQNAKKGFDAFKEVFNVLGKIPWVKLLAVTGSFAAFNPTDDDDVDIFIVTQAKRLWITRLFVVLLLKLLGKYRSDKDPVSKVCPNIYVSEEDLSWAPESRNLYIAHEIAMMHPIINRDNMYFRFLKANDWVLNYFANFEIGFSDSFESKKCFSCGLLDLLEFLVRTVQLAYMKRRKTTEIVTPKLIHFKRGDNTLAVLDEYKLIISGLV